MKKKLEAVKVKSSWWWILHLDLQRKPTLRLF